MVGFIEFAVWMFISFFIIFFPYFVYHSRIVEKEFEDCMESEPYYRILDSEPDRKTSKSKIKIQSN